MTKKLLRFHNLKERQIVNNRVTLGDWIRTQGFPPGSLLGERSRAWTEKSVQARGWLAVRSPRKARRHRCNPTSSPTSPSWRRQSTSPARVNGPDNPRSSISGAASASARSRQSRRLKSHRLCGRQPMRPLPDADAEALRVQRRNNRRTKNWRAANPLAAQAHSRVQAALDAGKLKRGPCEQCGATKTEAHHDPANYHRPLDVQWLCRCCHNQLHARLRAEARMAGGNHVDA